MSASRLAKRFALGTAALLVAPLILAARIERRLGASDLLFTLGAELLALGPGSPGVYMRIAYYRFTLEQCAWEAHVGFGSVFVRRAASLGHRASMGRYCVIGDAQIGEGVMIGSRVSVPSGKRQHLDAVGRLSAAEGQFDRVTIGAGCWVGEGAIVMSDIGAGCIVAAGAVVSSAMPARSMVAGNPARAVRAVESVERA